YETLRALNPRLVYCSISGYGQDGPYRARVGHDVNYLGFAGVIDLTGTAGGAPAIPGVQIADIGGGALMAAVGILAALSAREETGRGQFVDIAMMDGAVAWQVVNVFRHLLDGREPARGDTMLTGHHPCYAIYETRDGRHVTVGALEPHFWRTLCERLGMPEVVEKQFAEGAEREDMFRRLRARFREKTMAEWVAELAAREWGGQAAGGEKAVANHDEDSLTLAVNAALALEGAGERPDAVFFATTTSPYTEKQGAATIAAVLDLPGATRTADFTDTLRAGTSALLAGLDALAGGARGVLVAAGECRLGEPDSIAEQSYGDAGAAVLLGGGAGRVRVVATHSS